MDACSRFPGLRSRASKGLPAASLPHKKLAPLLRYGPARPATARLDRGKIGPHKIGRYNRTAA
jgi:hypothetical protein